MYGGGCALAVFLYVLERTLRDYYVPSSSTSSSGSGGDGGRYNEESIGHSGVEEGAMVEFARQIEGLYLVFVPFFPCLLWSLVVRSRWVADISLRKEKKE